jgi:hypothetical protein
VNHRREIILTVLYLVLGTVLLGTTCWVVVRMISGTTVPEGTGQGLTWFFTVSTLVGMGMVAYAVNRLLDMRQKRRSGVVHEDF